MQQSIYNRGIHIQVVVFVFVFGFVKRFFGAVRAESPFLCSYPPNAMGVYAINDTKLGGKVCGFQNEDGTTKKATLISFSCRVVQHCLTRTYPQLQRGHRCT
jgi:hypothetical protein